MLTWIFHFSRSSRAEPPPIGHKNMSDRAGASTDHRAQIVSAQVGASTDHRAQIVSAQVGASIDHRAPNGSDQAGKIKSNFESGERAHLFPNRGTTVTASKFRSPTIPPLPRRSPNIHHVLGFVLRMDTLHGSGRAGDRDCWTIQGEVTQTSRAVRTALAQSWNGQG